MGKVYITPLMRAVWHETIAMDKMLPNVATRVAVAIGRHFNNNTAETFVGQDKLASELKISKRLVWGSIKALRDRGHLIVRHGGRRSNYCGMPIEKVAAECELYRGGRREKVAAECDIQLWQRSQKPTEKVAAECELTLLPTEVVNSGARDLLQVRWRTIKERLAHSEQFGKARAEAWLDKLFVEKLDVGVVVLCAPTKFVASYVTSHYDSVILAEWRAIDPTVTRLAINVSPRRPTAETQSLPLLPRQRSTRGGGE